MTLSCKTRVISVRKEAEFPSRAVQERCPRWNADTLETSCQGDVEEFQDQGCAENCRDSTSAKIGTDDRDDDSQQGPEHADARPRADSSAVARYDVADLEQTSLG